MFRKTLLLIGLAGALTLMAACGGGSSDDSATASNDASAAEAKVQSADSTTEAKPQDNKASGDARTDMCTFISPDEVSAILGETMREGDESLNQRSSKLSLSQCTWVVDGSDHHALASVFQRKSNEQDAASTFERGRAAYPDAKDVSGLGEKAYFVPSMGQLNVLDGDAWFIVSARKGAETTNAGTELTSHVMKLSELVVKKY